MRRTRIGDAPRPRQHIDFCFVSGILAFSFEISHFYEHIHCHIVFSGSISCSLLLIFTRNVIPPEELVSHERTVAVLPQAAWKRIALPVGRAVSKKPRPGRPPGSPALLPRRFVPRTVDTLPSHPRQRYRGCAQHIAKSTR